ncbi:catalase/peroxidase HPI [Niameybacter massiliensis]|uniref:catalase/peroxidase HPI n=1 Tax=Niameybacter massiliensis TaxID=1658108 RepID=UPI0006B589AD|nr:catalase/peroxidase HPI [Niameybacter massiliensis]
MNPSRKPSTRNPNAPNIPSRDTHNDCPSEQLNLNILSENSSLSNPMSPDFNYAEAFNRLPLNKVKEDLYHLITTSQDWWPADYGSYAPFLIRMAWHSAGTYRVSDGRGGSSRGTQRFSPLDSWPDNANLDKARRLLWPIKQKYGNRISWADLMILAGNSALESMGFKTLGFAGGREDVWEPQIDVYWGTEKSGANADMKPAPGQLENPLAAVQMGLIYVNPEGHNGVPDPLKSAEDVRATFSNMAMNDEETVALIAGGHTFGKAHGAAPATFLGPPPEAAPIEEQGLGWKNSFGTGNADDTITSGIEGAWKPHPIKWDMGYLTTLFKYEWELVKSPAGAYQWLAKDVEPDDMVEDAHDPTKKHRPMMTTADLALRADPIYESIARNFLNNPKQFQDQFARAWFKLTHRDMGPVSRYLGPEVPKEQFIWQDPLPSPTYPMINQKDIAQLKKMIMHSELTIPQLVKTAWASASTFRGSDRRGGANGARLRLHPQIGWEVNEPDELLPVLKQLEAIQSRFNHFSKYRKVSMADLIVLGGAVGIEKALKQAGYTMEVPFTPGRTDASQDQTDSASFAVLEPKVDGFRNYAQESYKDCISYMLIDKAQLLTLTAPEMTALLGGLRVLDVNYNGNQAGVFTHRKTALTNDFFVNLLDMNTIWKPSINNSNLYVGYDRTTGKPLWTATEADLIFGSNSQLRAISEVYASNGNEKKFLQDFINAWNKVMNADRFDIK